MSSIQRVPKVKKVTRVQKYPPELMNRGAVQLEKTSRINLEHFVNTFTKRELAKICFFASAGKVDMIELAKVLHVPINSLWHWRKTDKWDEFVEKISDKVSETTAQMLKKNSKDNPTRPFELFQVIPEFRQAISEIIGVQVSELVTNIVASFHANDLEHLKKLNEKIDIKLSSDELSTKEILELTNSKNTMIKALRIIFNLDAQEPIANVTNMLNTTVEINITSEQFESLKSVIGDVIEIDNNGNKAEAFSRTD